MSKKKSHELFVSEMNIKNPNTMILGNYVSSNTKIQCKCKSCGFVWFTTPASLLQGHGCKRCGHIRDTKQRTKSTEKFTKELSLINPTIEVLGEYATARKVIKCRCKKCGFEWEPIAGHLLRGRGCPNCSHSSTSFLEQCILLSFIKALGTHNVKSRDILAIGKELDVYIPSRGFAVEPGGWYWHKDKLIDDRNKYELCKSKGISLWTIYDGFTGKEPPLKSNCICFHEDLSDIAYADTLFSLIRELFSFAQISKELTPEEWSEIQYQARLNSRKKDTQRFIDELQHINPTIHVIGEYLNNTTPVECECSICGNKWKTTPSSLLSGSGCSSCSNKRLSITRTKTDTDFSNSIEAILPNIILLEKYQNLKTKILCQCKNCGNTWYAYPGNLLKGHGCRKCSYATIANKDRKSEDEFQLQVKKIDPNLEITSRYLGSHYTITVVCRKCGHTWSPRATNLLHSKGCPVCSKIKTSSRKSNQDFVSDLQEVNDTIFPLEEYVASSKKISAKCAICGHVWEVTPKSLLQGNGCPECGKIRSARSRRKIVGQYSLNGDFICKFDSCKEASKKTGANLTGIQAAARGDRKTCNGFVWRYIN